MEYVIITNEGPLSFIASGYDLTTWSTFSNGLTTYATIATELPIGFAPFTGTIGSILGTKKIVASNCIYLFQDLAIQQSFTSIFTP